MFDPYYKWLGIPRKDQPPHHYRLLGLEIFERDLDVIEGAADRLMSFVRQYQSGENATEAARILNELAVARLCLLKPEKKAAYDEQLRKKQALPVANPQFTDLSTSFFDGLPVLKPQKRKKKPSRSQSPRQLMIGSGIAIVVCLVCVVFLFSGGGRRAAEKPIEPTKAAAANHTKPEVDVGPTKSTLVNESDPNPFVWKMQKLVAEPSGDPVDLLKFVDLQRDVLVGDWQQTQSALVGPAAGRIYLPGKPPEDYQLKLTVRRVEKVESLSIGFIMAGRQGWIAFDGWGATVNGLYCVDGRDPTSNCTTFRGKLFQGQSASMIVLTVHPGHLHASVDGRVIVDWFGDPLRLFPPPEGQMGSRESPLISVADAKYVIESAVLIPINPEPAPARMARLDRVIEILPLLDTERDAAQGIWDVSKNTISSPDSHGQIYVPTIVPEEYTISATVELRSQSQADYTVTFGLVADNSYFQFTITSGASGIDMIDGRRWQANETTLTGSRLKLGVPARIDCTVTKGGVRIDVDGRPVVDWQGDTRRLSVPGDWALANSRRLFIASSQHFKFRDVKLGPPIPASKLPEHPPLSIGKSIDLLALIDPARDAFDGTWERDGRSLRCKGDVENAKLSIPFDVPDEYKLILQLARIEGGKANNECLHLGIPLERSETLLLLDALGSTGGGLELDWEWVNETSYGGGPVIPSDSAIEIVVIAQKTGLHVSCGGKTIIDWTGNPERCWFPFSCATPGRRISLGSFNQGFRFEKVELEPLPPTEFPVAMPLNAGENLIPIINVDRDSRKGKWQLDGQSLICPAVQGLARLRIPARVPQQYVFSATVERKQEMNDLIIGLVVGGRPCAIAIDGDRGHQAGIDLLDGNRFYDNSNFVNRRYSDALLPMNQGIPIHCTVLPDAIVVNCGNREVIRWHGDPRRLSLGEGFLPPNYCDEDRACLWIGGWYSQFAIRDIELKPLSDAEAEQLSKSFSGVFPTTSQQLVPLVELETRPSRLPVKPNSDRDKR